MSLRETISTLPQEQRIVWILLLAASAHLIVRGVRAMGERIFLPGGSGPERLRRYPKVVTLGTLFVSATTFVVYFTAFGFVLSDLGVPLGTYLASASVIGLAVAFGSQGLVQDVVTGLTLIFSDVLDVGDVVDISGQTGRVEKIGLRFTVLVNMLDQRVFVPNRSINQISRYRGGAVRAYVDLQLPPDAEEERIAALVVPIARAVQAQHRGVLLGEPEVLGVQATDAEGWRYLRLKFRIWPGQGGLLENAFVRRAVAAIRTDHPEYADWMATVTYRAE
jgi:moderate conductance mechanosensitive channel